MTQKPRRPRTSDRLLNADATVADLRCDVAVAPFDDAARRMDRKWGTDRLIALAAPEMADKYARGLHAMNEAIKANEPEKVQSIAQFLLRGMQAMDAAATAAGHDTARPEVVEYTIDDWTFGIVTDDRFHIAAQTSRPDIAIFTMREIGIAVKAYKYDWLDTAKKDFPGAEVIAIRSKTDKLPNEFWKKGGDDL